MKTVYLRSKDGSPRELMLVTSAGQVMTVARDNPNWKKIEAAVTLGDEQTLIKLISIKESIRSFGDGVKGRGDITIKNDTIFYRGEKLFGEDVNRIISYLKDGLPQESMIRFLEAKLLNPSPESVASLYLFLENRGMPLTDNGTVLGYKGVESDFYSKNTGEEPLIEGIRDDRGKIRNQIGDVVWMDRRYVCADNSQACAGGLHIGSKDYATGWADSNGHVMVVEFSPEHVVSVPTSEHEKLRVHKYRVVGELSGVLGDTYNSDYVRPENAPNPDETAVVEDEVERYNISDWSRGQTKGIKDGRSHQKRLFYECDKGRTFKKYSKEWVDGYLAGYRTGREK